jgi:hypothetical protein
MQGPIVTQVIMEQLFSEAISAIAALLDCACLPENSKMILTEKDLQARIVAQLLRDLGAKYGSTDGSMLDKIGIHCELSFMHNGQLRLYPDIAILDTQGYSVDRNGELYQRKGYTVWGNAILIELKLRKSQSSGRSGLDSWEKDIDKLSGMLSNGTYSDPDSTMFPLFVLFSRGAMDSGLCDEIARYGSDRGVEVLVRSVALG